MMQTAGSALFSATARTALRSSGIGLVVAGVIASPALAQTVQVGTDTVTVPSNGQITVDGQTVTVMPGVTRVVVAAPPAGSTPVPEGGQTDYQLPAGATGASFTYPSANTDAATLPTTAVYGSPNDTTTPATTAQAARRDVTAKAAASGPTCVITPYPPSPNGGRAQVKGTSLLDCTGPDAGKVDVRVRSTLYWMSIHGGSWVWQGNATSPWGKRSEDVTFPHACTRGTQSWWHTRGDGLSIYDNLEVSYKDNSRNVLVPCS
jgi:hypothetical protein